MMQDNNFPPEMATTYRHFDDPRGEQEIQLTNRLALSLSQLNINSLPTPLLQSQRKSVRKEDFLYVCINGIPPFDNEFDFLQLPGECIFFRPPCFQKGLSEQEMMIPRDFAAVAQLLHEAIGRASKDKPIVVVYHSFGTFIFAQYCQMFKNDRIIGIIDAGGAPLRFYPVAKSFVRDTNAVSEDFLRENLEIIFQVMSATNKQIGIDPYKNKQEVFGMYMLFRSQPGFKEIFEYVRQIPKVLKCFIYGKKDNIFLQSFLHEKMVFFSYQNKFGPAYEALLQKTYQRCWGKKCENVQERFVYCIEGGHHSLHMQRKFKEVNAAIVHRYLTFLEELQATEQPRL